jgi:hypothetical protein
LLKKVFEVSGSATLIQDPSARRTKDSQPSGFGFEYCALPVRFRVFQQTARHHRKRNPDLVHSGAPTPESETDVEIAPLVQKIGATSIAEVEKMIGELQVAKDFLDFEGERVQREAEHYTTLTQMASASVKIIADTVAGWREAGHPLRDHSRSSQFDLTPSPADDNTTSARARHE